MPQERVLRAVLAAARRVSGYPRIRVLDLSSGRGEALAALAREGCAVRGTRYREDDYKLAGAGPLPGEGLPLDRDVDLTRPLPYPDSSFDCVILCEVAEHLATWIPVIGEAGRVLAPGGTLILSTPNLARLHSRWHFLWTGTHKLIRRPVGWDVSASDLYAFHISPVDFPLLHTLLHQAGLRVVRLDVTRFKARHAWLFLFYPFVWLATRLAIRPRGDRARRDGERDLFRWMVHPAMLGSEQLLLTARRDR